jgi:hypothetical protein
MEGCIIGDKGRSRLSASPPAFIQKQRDDRCWHLHLLGKIGLFYKRSPQIYSNRISRTFSVRWTEENRDDNVAFPLAVRYANHQDVLLWSHVSRHCNMYLQLQKQCVMSLPTTVTEQVSGGLLGRLKQKS